MPFQKFLSDMSDDKMQIKLTRHREHGNSLKSFRNSKHFLSESELMDPANTRFSGES